MIITKKQLLAVRYLNQELETWVRKKCEVDYGIKSPQFVLDKVQTSHDKNAEEEKRIIGLEISEQINIILGNIQKERLEIFKCIAQINDSRLRQIIDHRCLSLCSWNEVATNIGGETSDSARMYFNRAFVNGKLKAEFYTK